MTGHGDLIADVLSIAMLAGIFYRMGSFTSELAHVKRIIAQLERIVANVKKING